MTTKDKENSEGPDVDEEVEDEPAVLYRDADGTDWKRPEDPWLAWLSELLLAEHLVFLSGLGTSLCLNPPGANGNDRIAPLMKDLWTRVQEEVGEDVFADVAKAVNYAVDEGGANIEALLSKCQMFTALGLPDTAVGPFVAAAEKLIAKSVAFPSAGDPVPTHERFVRVLNRRPERLSRVKVFTTNYDRCFEEAASRVGSVVLDGFALSGSPRFDPSSFDYDIVRRDTDGNGAPTLVPNVLKLYKLHGSVDWQLEGNTVFRRSEPCERPVLVYPRDSKYQSAFDQPYFDMMSRFQTALRQPDVALVVIGFGFHDKHIAEPIMNAVRMNGRLRLIVVDPFIDQVAADSARPVGHLLDLIRRGDRRITLVKGGFEEFVRLLPELRPRSLFDLHGDRLAEPHYGK